MTRIGSSAGDLASQRKVNASRRDDIPVKPHESLPAECGALTPRAHKAIRLGNPQSG